jgi:hypothetical protein
MEIAFGNSSKHLGGSKTVDSLITPSAGSSIGSGRAFQNDDDDFSVRSDGTTIKTSNASWSSPVSLRFFGEGGSFLVFFLTFGDASFIPLPYISEGVL